MKIKINLKEVTQAIREETNLTQKAIREERPALLKALGIQLLSLSRIDYETKGRGGTGVDGIAWKPLAPSTIEQKNRRGKKQSGTAAKAAEKTLKGRKRGGQTRKAKAAKAFLRSAASTQIGVDTGMQRASSAPGFRGGGGTKANGKPGKGSGGNLFDLKPDAVTVGYLRSYSQYFDAVRPIFPTELPGPWNKELELILKDWMDRIINENNKNGGAG